MKNLKGFNQLFENNDEPSVTFKDYDCYIVFGEYANNKRTYMNLVEKSTGEMVADATVNMPEVSVPQGFVLIKEYSENEGMVDALVSAGIVEPPKAWVRGGMAAICKLLIQPK